MGFINLENAFFNAELTKNKQIYNLIGKAVLAVHNDPNLRKHSFNQVMIP